MKKIIILSCLLLSLSIFGEANNTRKQIIIKSRENIDPRNSIPVPTVINAFVDDSTLYIDLEGGLTPSSMSLTNTETGQSTPIRNLRRSQSTILDLSNKENGLYRLQVVINGELYWGEFEIEQEENFN